MAEPVRFVAAEAASRPPERGHETPQLRLERCLLDGSRYWINMLVCAGPVLDPVLNTTGSERRLVLLLGRGQHFTQPSHGPVEMVQLKRVTALDLIMLLPFVGGSITAGDEETMQHRQENGSLDVKLEATTRQKFLEDALAASLLPEPFKDQCRPDVLGFDNGKSTLSVSGQQEDGFGQASP